MLDEVVLHKRYKRVKSQYCTIKHQYATPFEQYYTNGNSFVTYKSEDDEIHWAYVCAFVYQFKDTIEPVKLDDDLFTI